MEDFLKALGEVVLWAFVILLIIALQLGVVFVICYFITWGIEYTLGYDFETYKAVILFYVMFFIVKLFKSAWSD